MKLIFTVFLCLLLWAAMPAQADLSRKDDLHPYEGTYEVAPGHRITLGIFDEFNRSLVYLDLKTLKQGALVSVSDGKFKENNDESLIFEFQRNAVGAVVGLKITSGANAPSNATKVMPHTRQPVSFSSGGRKLHGDLYLPDRKGKHPAVVFAHGSGPSTRGSAFFTTYFLQLGIAVLSFDKQGAGESEGDWETASFDELSDDIVAAVTLLKINPRINAKQIGIFGSSQGGWVGTMAASKSKDSAFLLMRVGSGENVADTIAHEYLGTFLADGLSDADANEAVNMFREHWTTSVNGGTWDDGNKVILKYQDRPWFKKIYSKPRERTVSSEKWWVWLRKNLGYDSYDYLKKIKIPVLWLMAEKDWNVNSQKGYPRVVKALQEAGNTDQTVKILPGMAHSGLTAKTGYYNEPFSWQYAPGFWDTMADWLKRRKIAR